MRESSLIDLFPEQRNKSVVKSKPTRTSSRCVGGAYILGYVKYVKRRSIDHHDDDALRQRTAPR